MTPNPPTGRAGLPSDDKEARKKALELIAENRRKQLATEKERRAQREQEKASLEERQQEATLAEASVAAEHLAAHHAFVGQKRAERAQMEEERKAKLKEQERLAAEQAKKDAEEKERQEYMAELHAKSLQKKIEAKKESIAYEEESSLKEIKERQENELREIDAEEKRKIEHIEKEAKREAQMAQQECDQAKVMADDKRKLDLSSLKKDTYERERAALKMKEPQRSQEILTARKEAVSKKMQIEQAYKIACRNADTKLAEGQRDRTLELGKRIAEAHKAADDARKKKGLHADERRKEAHVRRVGEEQWLLGKDDKGLEPKDDVL